MTSDTEFTAEEGVMLGAATVLAVVFVVGLLAGFGLAAWFFKGM